MDRSAQDRQSPVRKHFLTQSQYLRNIDPSFLKRASCGVMSAKVPIFAPVAAESAVHTGQAPAEPGKEIRSVLQSCLSGNELSTATDRPIHLHVQSFMHRKICSWQKTKTKTPQNWDPITCMPNITSVIYSYFCIPQCFCLFRWEVLWRRDQAPVKYLAHFWALQKY